MISKSLSTSRKFAKLATDFSRVLYVLIVAHADDFGRQSGDTFTVKHQVFPTSPRDEAEFEAALNNLQDCGLIQRYPAGDETVLQVVGFDQHQVGLHKRTNSRFPEQSGTSGNFPEIPSEFKGTEGNRNEGNGNHRGGGLITSPAEIHRLEKSHAFVGSVLRIPIVLHSELVAKSGTGSDGPLRAWYQTLDADLEQSGKGYGDIFAWLRPRHQAFAISQGWIDAAPKAGKPQVKHRGVAEIIAEREAKKKAAV